MAAEGIGRRETYKRKLFDLDRRKITVARDAQGEPTLAAPKEKDEYGTEAHEVVRTLQRELGSQESFVCIQLNGSLTRGHSTPDSDIDLLIVCDVSNNPSAPERMMQIYNNEIELLKERGVLKRKVHEIIVGLSPEIIEHLLQRDADPNKKIDQVRVLYGVVAGICGLAVGPRIEEYRKIIGSILKQMEPKRGTYVLRRIAAAALAFEEKSSEKQKERVANLKKREESQIVSARALMWMNRIIKNLGLRYKE